MSVGIAEFFPNINPIRVFAGRRKNAAINFAVDVEVRLHLSVNHYCFHILKIVHAHSIRLMSQKVLKYYLCLHRTFYKRVPTLYAFVGILLFFFFIWQTTNTNFSIPLRCGRVTKDTFLYEYIFC